MPADARAEADGLEELSSEYRSAPAGIDVAQADPAAVISSRLHDPSATRGRILGNAARIMDECAREAAEDLERMGEDYGRRAGTGFITVALSGLVAGALVPARDYAMHCRSCGKTTRFRLLPGSGRVSEIVSGSGLLGSVDSIMATARVAECCQCGATVEINPASAAKFDYVEIASRADEMAGRFEDAKEQGPGKEAGVQTSSADDPTAIKTPSLEDAACVQAQS